MPDLLFAARRPQNASITRVTANSEARPDSQGNADASMSDFDLDVCRVASAGRIQILRTGRHNDICVHLASEHDIVASLGFGGLDGKCAVRVEEEIREQIPGLRCKAQPN